MNLNYYWPLILLVAGVLEVSGDAAVRKGLRGGGWLYIAAGCMILAAYGLAVNLLRWDFGKLLGVYVAVFALISVLWGRYVLNERLTPSTKVGVTVVMLGGFIISWSEIQDLIQRFLVLLRGA